MKRLLVYFSTLLPVITSLLVVQPAYADLTIEVSGNGADTQNSVSANVSQTTSVSQANTADTTNSIQQSANTGGNSASDNTGDVTNISTGNVTTQTEVANNLNSSTIQSQCCQSHELDINVSGNGENSQNSVIAEVTSVSNVNVSQSASVQTLVSVQANTGDNRANNNGGNVFIRTGNIYGQGNLVNSINYTSINFGNGNWDILISTKKNGANSVNSIVTNFINDLLITKTDVADVKNQIYADLNTGGNLVLGNLNDVFIKTGDVQFAFNVVNDPVNYETIKICCQDGEIPGGGGNVPPPGPGGNPVAPPPSGGSPGPTSSSSGNGGGNGGSVLAALAQILPATGASAFHFWIMAVVYLLTFLLGLYVRLRAGRSPTYRHRYAYTN